MSVRSVFPDDIELVVANVKDGGGILRTGALAQVVYVPGMGDRARVFALSIGGRMVGKWVSLKSLSNARIKRKPKKIVKDFRGYHGRPAAVVVEMINGQLPEGDGPAGECES